MSSLMFSATWKDYLSEFFTSKEQMSLNRASALLLLPLVRVSLSSSLSADSISPAVWTVAACKLGHNDPMEKAFLFSSVSVFLPCKTLKP